MKPKPVYAVGVSVASMNPEAVKRIESAMIEALNTALREGVSIQNSEELIRRQMAARARVIEAMTVRPRIQEGQ